MTEEEIILEASKKLMNKFKDFEGDKIAIHVSEGDLIHWVEFKRDHHDHKFSEWIFEQIKTDIPV